MYSKELNLIDETFVYLSQVVSKPDEVPHASPPEAEHIDAIIQLLERWPTSQRFPGTPKILLSTLPTSYLPVL